MADKPRLIELDALRGIAALSVCLLHFEVYPYGLTGVDLFFMISGFVIYMSVVNGKNLKAFWQSRVLRIYPVYWLSIIVALIFYHNYEELKAYKANDIMGNLLAMQLLFRAKLLVGVYWTLYIEMVFYILISLLWKLKLLKNIEQSILVLFIIIGVIIGIYILIGGQSPGYTRFFIVLRGIAPLITYFHFFAAGIVFYQLYYYGATPLRILLLALSFLFIPLNQYNTTGALNVLDEHIVASAIYYGLFVLIIKHKAGLLKHKAFKFFGDISYALYLLHFTFGLWVTKRLFPVMDAYLATAAGIAASILLSYVVTFYFDIPIRRYFKTRINVNSTAKQ